MSLTSVADALSATLDGVMPLEREVVGLRFAAGRTLAQPLDARVANPPFDASAMDGYAVIAADCARAGATLQVIGESAAGRPFKGVVARGTAARISTGAVVPVGADAVVIQENVVRTDSAIEIQEPAARGQNIRRKGQDFNVEDTLIAPGRRLTVRDIQLAAASGHDAVTAIRRPTVAILATGDELARIGGELGDGQVFAANCYGLAALVEAAGGAAKLLGIAGDTPDALAGALRDADSADILLTIGGASVGDHDLVRPALEAAGARLDVYKVAMRPGKPLFSGSRHVAGKTQRVVGVPGNPVSALVTARVFLVPLIARMLDRDDDFKCVRAELAAPLADNGPRTHYMRAILDETVSPPRVRAMASQDSSLMRTLAEANALIVVAPDAPAQPAGALVDVLKLDF